jgi:type I restriction enzyme, S subunit
MSKYQYKESGVDWLGEIPHHWTVDRIKDIFSERDEQLSKEFIQKQEEVFHFSIPAFDESQSPEVVSGDEVSSGKKVIRNGQLLFSKLNCWKPRVWLVEGIDEARINVGSTEFVVLNPWHEAKVERRYFKYLISSKSFIDIIKTNLKSVTNSHQRIQPNDLVTTIVPLPLKQEQIVIANYLDEACADIDKAINLKLSQKKTINEHCKSSIAEIVTKGVNIDAHLVECRITWLPAIPENWAVSRLKAIADLRSGDGITSENISKEGEYPVFGGNGLRGYTEDFTHEGNFILIGRQGALCGNINYASGKFFASEHAVVLTPIRKYDTIWLGELLRYMNLNQYSNAAAQPGLSVEKIKNLYIPLPKYEEQVLLSSEINKVINNTKLLVDKIDQQITTLEEYKKSLIHEVVTGKKQVYFAGNTAKQPKTKTELTAVV